jgi:hypothetical protein
MRHGRLCNFEKISRSKRLKDARLYRVCACQSRTERIFFTIAEQFAAKAAGFDPAAM